MVISPPERRAGLPQQASRAFTPIRYSYPGFSRPGLPVLPCKTALTASRLLYGSLVVCARLGVVADERDLLR